MKTVEPPTEEVQRVFIQVMTHLEWIDQARASAVEDVRVVSSCGTCVYWRNGECHAEPARDSQGSCGKWPDTHSSDWCGRWRSI